jgi:hypothetical protein
VRDATRPAEHPPSAHARRRWPWLLSGAALLLAHAGFFLPFRAIVPIPDWVDPWWAIALVIVDEAGGMLLMFRGIAKFRGKTVAKRNGEPD